MTVDISRHYSACTYFAVGTDNDIRKYYRISTYLRPVTDNGTSQDFCTGRYFTISSNTDVMTDNSAFIDKCPLPYTYITSNSCPRKNHNTWFDSIVIPAHKGFLGDKSGQYSSKTGNLSCQYLSTLSTSDTNNNLTVCFQMLLQFIPGFNNGKVIICIANICIYIVKQRYSFFYIIPLECCQNLLSTSFTPDYYHFTLFYFRRYLAKTMPI